MARLMGGLMVAWLYQPASAQACATCFGKSESPLAHGMNMGILVLLVFVVLMWVGFGTLFVYLARRSAVGWTAAKTSSDPAAAPASLPNP